MNPDQPPGAYLQRFARYQRALIHGGGAIVTLAILAALLFNTVSIVDRHAARERHALALELRHVADETGRFEASLRSLAVNAELLWQRGSMSADAAVDQFFAHQRVLALPNRPGIVVIGTDSGDLDRDKVARTIELATGMAPLFDAISHRGAMASLTYAVSEDRSLAVLSFQHPLSAADLAHVIADRHVLFRRLADQLATAGKGPPVGANATQLPRPVRWLAPIPDLLTGAPVIRIATVLREHQGLPAFDIVSELPAEFVTASLPHARFSGAFAVATPDGQIIASATTNPLTRAALERRMPALAAGSSSGNAHEFAPGGMLVFRERFGTTSWTLLYAVPWQTVLDELDAPVAATLAISLGIIAMIWTLLAAFDYKVFRPMLARSMRVLESEHLSRTLVNTVPVGLALVDMRTATSLLRSPAMMRLESSVCAGAHGIAAMLLQCYAHATHASSCTAEADRPDAVSDVLTLERPDAAPMQVALRLASDRYQGRDVLVAALTDVTAEHELKIRMTDAQRAAQTANAAKSAFLAATSHEIRTPLHGMLGHLELLARSELDTTQRKHVTTIQQAGHQLTRIINDILDWSKIESGEMRYERIAFDVVTLVEQASTLFVPGTRAKSLELVHEFATIESRYWTGDPTRIAQIVHNLLSNAIKFTEHGRITLTLDVSPGSLSTDPSTLEVGVDDTGIGIDPAQQAGIFDAFRQADTTVPRRFGGTGLGLSLCKRLTEGMGGTISVDSVPGRGSHFRVRMPVAAAAQPVDSARAGTLTGISAILAVARPEWTHHVTRHLVHWGVSIAASGHPAELGTAAAHVCDVMILWGNRADWHAVDEDRLLNAARRVVIASPDGPSLPTRIGRVTSISCYTIDGLYASLGGSHAMISPLRPPDRQDIALGLTILVVDDNPANRRLIAEQLRVLGCDVEAVESGEQALILLYDRQFDVLLTDLNMPGMTGGELALEARRRGATVPIVSVSANPAPDVLSNARESGIEQTLIKPVTLSMLFDALKQHAGADQSLHALPESSTADRIVPADMGEIFSASVFDDLARLRRACLAVDLDGLRDPLHSLKGCFGAFGFAAQAVQVRTFEHRLDEAPARDMLADMLQWIDTVEQLVATRG
ncbi:ATP-binding protein [Burkholderia sp. AW49-1]